MITFIYSTGIYVSDQDAAVDFYVNKLGFELRVDQPMGPGARWIEVAPHGAQTVLVLATKDYGVGSEEKIGTFTDIILEVDDINETFKTLSKRGVVFNEEPVLQPWGQWHAAFVDPDGNEFYLSQRTS